MTEVTKQPRTLRDVLFDLTRGGLLDENAVPRIDAYLSAQPVGTSEPWFVKLLLALGAWVSAICFVVCLGVADLVREEPQVLFAWAVGFLVAAILLRNLTRHVFPHQLALALSAMGHFFAFWGAIDLSPRDAAAAAVTGIVLCLVLYPLYRDSLHRFLSCLLAAGCLTTWIVVDEVWPLIHVEMLAKVIGIGLVFMYRPDLRVLRPLGYAMAVSVPASLFLVLLPEDVFAAPWWPANAILAIALIWLYRWISGSWGRMRTEPLILAVLATLAMACFTTPGILAAVGLMVLGYARRDLHLMGIGVIFFPVFIVVFYYDWQISLLVKSWIMAGSGAVLLAARQYLNLRNWAQESLT